MGLTDMLPGVGGSDTRQERKQATRLVLADPNPSAKDSFGEYQLLIGPNPESNTDGWGVYRCTTRANIPSETKLYVFEEGSVVSLGGTPFQLCLAQLVQPEHVDESYDGFYIDFPAELAEQSIANHSTLSKDEFEMLSISLADF